MADNAKGRGRSRGRSRPPASTAGPAPVAVAVAAAAQASTSGTAAASSSSSGGRTPIGRAGSRPKPAEANKQLTQRMQSLTVSGSGGSGNGKGKGNGNGNGNGSGSDNGNGNGEPVGRFGLRGDGRKLEEGEESSQGPQRRRARTVYSRPESASVKKGSSGAIIRIQTNHFALSRKPNWTLFLYHVNTEPEEENTKVKKFYLRAHRARLGDYIYTGTNLYSINRLDQNMELISQTRAGELVKITLRLVGTIEPSDHQYLSVINSIFRTAFEKLNLVEVRRNYFDSQAEIQVPAHNLKLWPGYLATMGQYEYNILLQAEIVHKVLRRDTPYELFRSIHQHGGDRNFQNSFKQAILGTIVMTTYNNKTYRVDDVDFSSTPQSTFSKRGVNVSYVDYYESTYQLRIRDLNQPMLVSRRSARERRAGQSDMAYLVPELCIMTGLDDQMRSNYTLMRAVAEHTAVGPSQRVQKLLSFQRRFSSNAAANAYMNTWGLQLSPNLVEVDGRQLANETIYVSGRQFSSGPDVDWTRSLRSNRLLYAVPLDSWVIVFPSKLEAAARDLVRNLTESGRGMSFVISSPTPFAIPNDATSSYVQGLDQAINKYNPKLILCVVPNNRGDRYNAIKKKCILEKPVPSQVVLLKNIQAKSAMSIATKIAVQLNCKLGGAAWTVDNPLKECMFVGFDACHDSREKSKSFGAMVASMNAQVTSYFSTLNHHSNGADLSSAFSLNILKAAEHYRTMNKKLPQRVIIYRDGVGEGDLFYVFEEEVKNIRDTLGDLYAKVGQKLMLAVIVVTKRINTRLFASGKNPPPGTIVDDVITDPTKYDFFLVSQSVRQGTVMPTHYNVIYDTTGLKPDQIQRMTYKMTHLYFNWSGTVRVPAPCQYAHKLAFLTAQSLGQAHSNLNQLLYFL